MVKRGLQGPGNKLRPTPSDTNWMPGVIFEPQETGPRNRANCRPVEPTWYYQEQDMPTFRPRGPGDIEDLDSEPGGNQGYPGPKPQNTGAYYAPTDWDGTQNTGAAPRTNKKKGRI